MGVTPSDIYGKHDKEIFQDKTHICTQCDP